MRPLMAVSSPIIRDFEPGHLSLEAGLASFKLFNLLQKLLRWRYYSIHISITKHQLDN
jgi:hypothetical protein